MNAYAYRIYAARSAPFRIERVYSVLYLYILCRRRLYHIVLLTIQVFLGPQYTRTKQVIELLRRFLLIVDM